MAIGKPQLRIIHLYAEFLTNRMYDVPLPCLIAQRVLKATFLRCCWLKNPLLKNGRFPICMRLVHQQWQRLPRNTKAQPVSAVSWFSGMGWDAMGASLHPQVSVVPSHLAEFLQSFLLLYLAWSENVRAPYPANRERYPPKIPCFILFHHHLPKDKMAISRSPIADPTSQLRWRCSSAK